MTDLEKDIREFEAWQQRCPMPPERVEELAYQLTQEIKGAREDQQLEQDVSLADWPEEQS